MYTTKTSIEVRALARELQTMRPTLRWRIPIRAHEYNQLGISGFNIFRTLIPAKAANIRVALQVVPSEAKSRIFR